MRTHKKGVTGLKSSNRIAVTVMTAVIMIVGGTTMVPSIVQPAFAMQFSYPAGEKDDEEWGLSAEINQFTNNLIDRTFEDNGLKDDEQGELSADEQQVSIDSEAGRTNVIIHRSSSSSEGDDEGELNSSLSTFVYNSQHGTFADDVASGESDEDNFSQFVEDVIPDSIDEGIVDLSPFFWWRR